MVQTFAYLIESLMPILGCLCAGTLLSAVLFSALGPVLGSRAHETAPQRRQ